MTQTIKYVVGDNEYAVVGDVVSVENRSHGFGSQSDVTLKLTGLIERRSTPVATGSQEHASGQWQLSPDDRVKAHRDALYRSYAAMRRSDRSLIKLDVANEMKRALAWAKVAEALREN